MACDDSHPGPATFHVTSSSTSPKKWGPNWSWAISSKRGAPCKPLPPRSQIVQYRRLRSGPVNLWGFLGPAISGPLCKKLENQPKSLICLVHKLTQKWAFWSLFSTMYATFNDTLTVSKALRNTKVFIIHLSWKNINYGISEHSDHQLWCT